MYVNKQEFHDDTKALKKTITKKNKKKEYVNADMQQIKIITKSWDYGRNVQKDCRLGVQSVLQRLCSHFITSNLKIPKSCNHSFCIFAKENNCCQEFRWIYTLRHQTPYCQFNIHQRICNIFPAESSHQNHQLYQFTMKAIFDQIINESTSNNQLIIRINEKKSCSLFLKRIGKDALAKAFDSGTDGFRVSYVPTDQQIAISVTKDIVMILSGGIVGTGYCNLIETKSKKTKEFNDGHAIIHILDEHLKNINIRFFAKNGFNGNIDVAIKSGDFEINLTDYQNSGQSMDKIEEDDDIKYNTHSLSPSLPSLPTAQQITNPFIIPSPLFIPSQPSYDRCANDTGSVYDTSYFYGRALLSPDAMIQDDNDNDNNMFDMSHNFGMNFASSFNPNTRKRCRDENMNNADKIIPRKRQRLNNKHPFNCNQSNGFCQQYY